MFKRLFILACLSLAILPGCSSNIKKQKSGDETTIEEPQYKEKISYVNGMVTEIDLCEYTNGLRTFFHSKLYNKSGSLTQEKYIENEYDKKQPIRENSTITDYSDDPVQITSKQDVYRYDSRGNIVHRVVIEHSKTEESEKMTPYEMAAEYKYDTRGNVLEETVYEYGTTIQNNSNGKVWSIEGHKTVATYDRHNRVLTRAYYELYPNEEYEPEFMITGFVRNTYEKNKLQSISYYYNDISNDYYPSVVNKKVTTEKYNNANDLVERYECLYSETRGIAEIKNCIFEYGQNHCCIYEKETTVSTKGFKITNEVFTTYLNNNPNKILVQNTFTSTQASSLVNEYDSKGRLTKSTTNTTSGKKSQVKTLIYKY